MYNISKDSMQQRTLRELELVGSSRATPAATRGAVDVAAGETGALLHYIISRGSSESIPEGQKLTEKRREGGSRRQERQEYEDKEDEG